MTERNRAGYLMKNTIIFAIGSFGTKMITFFLVPLYTNVLSTAEYGIVDLVTTLQTILVPVISLNIGEAVMRFMLNRSVDKDKVINIGFTAALAGTLFGLLIIPVLSMFSSLKEYSIHIYLSIVSMMYSNVFLCGLRGKEMLSAYSLGNIINTLFIAVLNIIFLVVFDMGIKGYFTAYAAAGGVTAVYAFCAGKGYEPLKKYSFDKKLFYKMIKYSVVLVPTSLMWWIINSSDRVMITAMIGASANGIYSVSYKLPTLITVVAGVFNQAWTYSAIHEEESKDKDRYTNSVYQTLSACIIVVAAALMMVIKTFLRIYVETSYYEAWKYTPYLIIGMAFSTLATFLATSYTVHFNSKGYLFSGMCGAAVNILLNTVFIPLLGISGAALATCISYISVFIYRAADTKKYIKIKILPFKNAASYIILIGMGFSMYIDNIYGQMLLIAEFILVTAIQRRSLLDIIKPILLKLKKHKFSRS